MYHVLAVVAMILTAAPSLAETPAWLTPGPGQEETAIACGVCHTLSYIRMNSRFMKPAVWKAEVDKMQAAFGAPIDDETAKTITAYLAKNFGAQ